MISLAKVKELLGITGTTYDAQIALMLPLVESDVRRILNHHFREKVYCTYTFGSTTISGLTSLLYERNFDHPVEIGRVIEGVGIPADTYVTDYDEETGEATISNATTDSGNYVRTSIQIGQWIPIAKMVWFKISKLNTDEDWKRVASQTMGPVSISFVDTIDARTGYPIDLIKDLGKGYQRV